MSREVEPLLIDYKIRISVPNWEYCNSKKDNASKKLGSYCSFLYGVNDERGCSIFNKSLYSSYDWVKKCDECLKEIHKEVKKNE